jgi:hypothetical protein
MLVVVVRIMVLENYSGMVIKCGYIDNKLVVCGDAWWGCCGGGEGLLMYMETRLKKKKHNKHNTKFRWKWSSHKHQNSRFYYKILLFK